MSLQSPRQLAVPAELAAALEDAAALSAHVCAAPLASVILTGDDDPAIVSVGFDTDVDLAPFCAAARQSTPVLIVADVQESTLAGAGLAAGVRSFAGVALVDDSGPRGSVCVYDVEPREFTTEAVVALLTIARLVLRQVEATARAGAVTVELEDLRAANEQLGAAAELQSHVAGLTGHELRAPLTGLAAIDLLASQWEQIDEAGKQKLLELARRAAHRVRDVADGLLRVAESAAAVAAAPRAVRLGPAIAEVVEELAVPGVEVDCPEDLVAWVTPGHLTQVLVNLITNAGRYGAPPIRVTGTRPRPDAVQLTVWDRGPGVDATVADRMFERYQQGEARADRSAGLGLALVLALVSANHGEIGYQYRDGARFELTLPVPATG